MINGATIPLCFTIYTLTRFDITYPSNVTIIVVLHSGKIIFTLASYGRSVIYRGPVYLPLRTWNLKP